MSRTPTELKDLAVGDVIYAEVIINILDIADPNSRSTTAKNVKKGRAVKRLCIVLVSGVTSVQVTYVATFGQSTTLPAMLDKTMWYPFAPATQEGPFAPIPATMSNGKAGWASLRTRQTITTDPVEKLDENVPAAWATAILKRIPA